MFGGIIVVILVIVWISNYNESWDYKIVVTVIILAGGLLTALIAPFDES